MPAIAILCAFGLARLVRGGANSLTLILAGVFAGTFFIDLVGRVQFVVPDSKLPSMVYWMLGTFVEADPQKVWMIAIPTSAGGGVLMMLRCRLNLVSFGDLDTESIGFNIPWFRWAIISIVSMIVASQAAVSGLGGCVGLVVRIMGLVRDTGDLLPLLENAIERLNQRINGYRTQAERKRLCVPPLERVEPLDF